MNTLTIVPHFNRIKNLFGSIIMPPYTAVRKGMRYFCYRYIMSDLCRTRITLMFGSGFLILSKKEWILSDNVQQVIICTTYMVYYHLI